MPGSVPDNTNTQERHYTTNVGDGIAADVDPHGNTTLLWGRDRFHIPAHAIEALSGVLYGIAVAHDPDRDWPALAAQIKADALAERERQHQQRRNGLR